MNNSVKGKKHCSNPTIVKYVSSGKSITSLPHEIIIRILKYCDPCDVYDVRQTNSFFFNVCKDIPIMSTKMFFQRIYEQGLDIMYQLHMRPFSYVDDVLEIALNSNSFRAFESTHPSDSVECGRQLLFIAICDEFLIESDPTTNRDQAILEILRCLKTNSPCGLNYILLLGSADVFSLATPTLSIKRRLAFALDYPVPALELLNQLLDTGETRPTFQDLKSVFELYPQRTVELMLKTNCNGEKGLADIYVNKYHSLKNLPLVLLDAVTSGHVDLNNPLQHVVCWIFISFSVSVLQKLSSHPKVDPTRWNHFALYCVISHGDIQSLTEILKDRRIDPMSYYDDIMNLDWLDLGLNLVKALFANPNFQRDYDDIRPMKKALQVWSGQELFNFLILDPKVNLGANNNELLFLAVKAGYSDLVETILNDKRINLAGMIEPLMSEAFSTKKRSVISAILRHPELDLSTIGPKLLQDAMSAGSSVTSHLLDRLHDDSSFDCQEAFMSFVKLSSPEPDIMRMFLDKPYIDPTINNNEPLRILLTKIHPDFAFEKDLFGFKLRRAEVNEDLLETTQALSQDKRVRKKLIAMQLAALES